MSCNLLHIFFNKILYITYMPSIISHGIIGYLLFGIKGLIFGILPDIIGNIYFSLRTLNNYNTYNPLKVMGHIKHEDFTEKDYEIYKLSHSLILWTIILIITKEQAVYAAIIGIIMDIFLHDNKRWKGPEPFYPLNNFRFNGINWSSKEGLSITITILIILLISKDIRETITKHLKI